MVEFSWMPGRIGCEWKFGFGWWRGDVWTSGKELWSAKVEERLSETCIDNTLLYSLQTANLYHFFCLRVVHCQMILGSRFFSTDFKLPSICTHTYNVFISDSVYFTWAFQDCNLLTWKFVFSVCVVVALLIAWVASAKPLIDDYPRIENSVRLPLVAVLIRCVL